MVSFLTAVECLEELDRLEEETGRRWSMTRSAFEGPFYPRDDHGRTRDVACATKKFYTSKSQAKKALKDMARAGKRGLVVYDCWYSRGGTHYHLGHPPGTQTYHRAGRIFG